MKNAPLRLGVIKLWAEVLPCGVAGKFNNDELSGIFTALMRIGFKIIYTVHLITFPVTSLYPQSVISAASLIAAAFLSQNRSCLFFPSLRCDLLSVFVYDPVCAIFACLGFLALRFPFVLTRECIQSVATITFLSFIWGIKRLGCVFRGKNWK